MKAPQDIIIAPIITEKSMDGLASKKYTFKVATGANKIEIAKAVEALFPGTKVAKVNTMNVSGKAKRLGRGIQWHRVLRDDAVKWPAPNARPVWDWLMIPRITMRRVKPQWLSKSSSPPAPAVAR